MEKSFKALASAQLVSAVGEADLNLSMWQLTDEGRQSAKVTVQLTPDRPMLQPESGDKRAWSQYELLNWLKQRSWKCMRWERDVAPFNIARGLPKVFYVHKDNGMLTASQPYLL
eukprot:3105453-Karenia_brevis.AAC.1